MFQCLVGQASSHYFTFQKTIGCYHQVVSQLTFRMFLSRPKGGMKGSTIVIFIVQVSLFHLPVAVKQVITILGGLKQEQFIMSHNSLAGLGSVGQLFCFM